MLSSFSWFFCSFFSFSRLKTDLIFWQMFKKFRFDIFQNESWSDTVSSSSSNKIWCPQKNKGQNYKVNCIGTAADAVFTLLLQMIKTVCLHLVLLCNSVIKFMNMKISNLTWLFCGKVSRHLKFCVWSMFRYWFIGTFMDWYDSINFLFSLIFYKQSKKVTLS